MTSAWRRSSGSVRWRCSASGELPVPCVVVPDPRRRLGLLARAVLDRLPDCTVIGVTGSSGKTSTKDLIASVLSRVDGDGRAGRLVEQRVGLPLTVLRADRRDAGPGAEMGARGIGHIATLTGSRRPDRRRPQRRHARTWGSTAPSRSSPRPRASWSRRCRPPSRVASRCSTRTTRACAPWPHERRPGWSSSASAKTPRCGRRTYVCCARCAPVVHAGHARGQRRRSTSAMSVRTTSRTHSPPPPWPASSGWP